MRNSQNCLILIDGSNFYFKLKNLGLHNLLKFNFTEFAKFLARSKNIIGIHYYVGRIKQDGSARANKMLADQQKLLAQLKQHKVRYSLGYLLKSDGLYHEKGVDVQIAVDMLIAAFENHCDHFILVSSDTDLAPAIKQVQKKMKFVEYIGFSHMPSVAMVRFCSESRLLTKEDMLTFILP